MADWLSEEWVAEVAGLTDLLPSAPGATGSVCLSFVLGPRREVAVHWAYKDGVPVDGGAGPLADAGLALAISEPDAAQVLSGEVEPSVAFMRGRLKASGDGSLLLAFLASTASDGLRTWRERVAELAPPPSS